MDTKVLTATVLSVIFFGVMGAASIASAQYVGSVGGGGGEAGAHELGVQPGGTAEGAAQHPDRELLCLDANGAMGASLIAGAVFGGVAGAFFLSSRSGKCAATCRG